jgi:hypothetical protein
LIRAITHPDHKTFGVMITVVEQADDASRPASVLRLAAGGETGTVRFSGWEPHERYAAVEPTLVLPEEVASALLDALNRHFHGVDDARALRRDLDGERNRADKLIDHLGAIARQLSGPAAR